MDAVQGPADDEAPAEVCLINIGPRERRRRMHLGYLGFVVGAGVAAALILAGVPMWWRLATFLPFALGGYGVFQARAGTWVRLASRGLRNMDTGVEKVEDDPSRRALLQRARQISLKSLALGLVLTAAVTVLPL